MPRPRKCRACENRFHGKTDLCPPCIEQKANNNIVICEPFVMIAPKLPEENSTIPEMVKEWWETEFKKSPPIYLMDKHCLYCREKIKKPALGICFCDQCLDKGPYIMDQTYLDILENCEDLELDLSWIDC